jgi:hypothetical protein
LWITQFRNVWDKVNSNLFAGLLLLSFRLRQVLDGGASPEQNSDALVPRKIPGVDQQILNNKEIQSVLD